jgi:hypothetical protein
MLVAEVISAPTKPLAPEQLRIRSLQQTVERGKQQLAAERERQHQQRELKRRQKAMLKLG